MIEYRALKSTGDVTDATILRSRYVACIFLRPYWSRRGRIAVTGITVTYDAGMIKGAIGETVANRMTRTTIDGRDRMRWCFS